MLGLRYKSKENKQDSTVVDQSVKQWVEMLYKVWKSTGGLLIWFVFSSLYAILNYWCLQHGSRQQQMRDWSSSWTILWLCTEVCLHVSDYLPLHMYACVGSLLHIFLSLNPFFLTQPLLHSTFLPVCLSIFRGAVVCFWLSLIMSWGGQ